ncbi:hypothetical protein OG230_28035 [Streptomyces sp. NBC_00234]|uniref:hypothetical protein n=1 Tax=Streptomyces sp. NBC_00234 TaxID=2903638 RepID=UPI002E2C53B5|nr:hypothetical protein [Streptomyces sp. NBC_00234]
MRICPLPTRTALLAAAACAVTLFPLAGTASASGGSHSVQASAAVPAEECKPDDQACKDREANGEQAKEIEEEQKKTQAAATQAGKDIDAAGKKLKECPPGDSSCMEELAGTGSGEKKGVSDMTETIGSFKPDPSDNAASAVESTCADFPGSLPAGSADASAAPFPVSQLCSLLGS